MNKMRLMMITYFMMFAQTTLIFKNSETYHGEKIKSTQTNKLGDDEMDNMICHSASFIGFVDAESPTLKDLEMTSKYLTWELTNNIFVKNKEVFKTKNES